MPEGGQTVITIPPKNGPEKRINFSDERWWENRLLLNFKPNTDVTSVDVTTINDRHNYTVTIASMRSSLERSSYVAPKFLRRRWLGWLALALFAISLVFSTELFETSSLSTPRGSSVAVCIVGMANSLVEASHQANFYELLIRPLQAAVFLHIDVDGRDEFDFKEVFPTRPATKYDIESMLRYLKPTDYEFQTIRSTKLRDYSKFKSQASKENIWWMQGANSMFPKMEHTASCFAMIQKHEARTGRMFNWVAFSKTNVQMRSRFDISSFRTAPHHIYVAGISTLKNQMKDELVMLPRVVASQYAGFNRLLREDYHRFDYSSCRGTPAAECLINIFIRRIGLPISELGIFIRSRKQRRCGRYGECARAAEEMCSSFFYDWCNKSKAYYKLGHVKK